MLGIMGMRRINRLLTGRCLRRRVELGRLELRGWWERLVVWVLREFRG